MSTDWVCGMHVDERVALHRLTYRGESYVFCSEACLEEFRRRPEEYRPGSSADDGEDV